MTFVTLTYDRLTYLADRPVLVNIETDHKERLQLPVVTVCTQNRYRYRSMSYQLVLF